jgi:predicted phage baseplate assembly protein
MNETCGCCEGPDILTPLPIANRPGLNALRYRVGTHASFLETMQTSLSSGNYPALRALTTRDPNDPAMALLDAWATIAHVLTFYQERIATEGYLRTATERRSILELARLVGYILRPGVAASVYLTYTLEHGYDVEIPVGSRAQSLPGPGELPQSFETSTLLTARAAWNDLKPRLSRPQLVTRENADSTTNAANISGLYLNGTATNLKPNDPLLLVFAEGGGQQVLRRIKTAELQAAENRTRVTLQLGGAPTLAIPGRKVTSLGELLEPLKKRPAVQPANALRLVRTPDQTFAPSGGIGPQLLVTLNPILKPTLYRAWGNAEVTPPPELKSLETLRVKAAPFGHNAPPQPVYNGEGVIEGHKEWPIAGTQMIGIRLARSTRGTLLNAFRAAPDAIQARVSIKRGADMRSTQVRLGQQITENREVIDVDLDGLSVRLTISYTVEGELTGESISEIVFEIVELAWGIRLTVEADRLRVRIDPNLERVVTQGQAWRFPIDERKVALEFLTDAVFSVTDESPAQVPDDQQRVLALDTSYDQITPNSWAVIERPDKTLICRVESVQTISKADYGITAKVTQLTLDQPWLDASDVSLSVLRSTTVLVQSEGLSLSEEPIDTDVQGDAIELGRLYDGLESGRWLFVSGERTDIPGTIGVRGSELVMLAGVEQRFDSSLPGDKVHTTLLLAKPLAYRYKRDTVTVYGNVVKATHGETRNEVLGSGDGSKGLQQFTLRQPPLTYVAAPNPSGVESTLEVRVNDVLWREVDSLAGLEPTDHRYVTRTDDAGRMTVLFGNGRQGARPPTGSENVKAVYRSGIGKPGNVRAEQISLLATRPLGVKSVINPLPATGGADSEPRDQARRNAPLPVKALDRLVSVQDYADFARTFAGIGKANAIRLSDGRRQLVHLTIAGADDIPIDESSDLYRNLLQALRKFGDPYQALQVKTRELLVLVISAGVRLQPEYQWESVAPQIRAALLEAFSFERRELGQDALLSEVLSTMQGVPGVAYVDVDIFDHVAETVSPDALPQLLDNLRLNARIIVHTARIDSAALDPGRRIRPAQLAFVTPEVPDTFLLRELST